MEIDGNIRCWQVLEEKVEASQRPNELHTLSKFDVMFGDNL